MRGFSRDERGVSSILGFILVTTLVVMALAAYLGGQMPEDWRTLEWGAMKEVKSSFMDLREDVQYLGAGNVAAVKVRMGILSPTAMVSSTTNASLKVFSALNINDLKENRYYDTFHGETRGYGTYVVEGSAQNYQSSTYDNDHLYVSAYAGNRMRTYLKFNFTDSFLYDSYNQEYEEDIQIHDVQLFVYVESVDPVTDPSEVLEAGPPLVIEPWLVEDDSWDESMTWATQPHNESIDTRLENVDANDYDQWLALEGYNFELSRVVKNHWNELRDNQINGRPCEDSILSFVLRETKSSSLRSRAAITSRDNYNGGYEFSPRLRITYSRLNRPARVSEGLVDFGYIRYEANNEYFPDQVYIYEGGMVITQRVPDWYETVLADPPDFITLTEVGGSNIRVTVRRYQIEESSLPGEAIGGTGYTSIRVQREEVENIVDMPSSPNRNEVTITVRTDQKAAWRDYLERLAAELNYKMGGEWDQYGDYVKYDYDSVSLTIRGKVLDSSVQDIYYAEQVIWLDTMLGTFGGGRT